VCQINLGIILFTLLGTSRTSVQLMLLLNKALSASLIEILPKSILRSTSFYYTVYNPLTLQLQLLYLQVLVGQCIMLCGLARYVLFYCGINF
jgi:hypothetical protein